MEGIYIIYDCVLSRKLSKIYYTICILYISIIHKKIRIKKPILFQNTVVIYFALEYKFAIANKINNQLLYRYCTIRRGYLVKLNVRVSVTVTTMSLGVVTE